MMREVLCREVGVRCGLGLCGDDFVDGVQILVENLVHGEHVNAVLFEDCAHGVVASNLALVGRVLQVALFDVLPNLLDGLWTRELCFA
ncbi:hypothetical protein IG631_12238 [Alternaria alternata]|nr:hypothetical protein IG631_12238 [Alternaria alternata]